MNLKFRLALMNFLEFAVWGAYLTCMGNYLGTVGLGDKISWFYSIQGLVSIFMPTIMGIVADKWIQPQRLLGLCHLFAGFFMLCLWFIGWQTLEGQEIANKSLFIAIYTLSVAFYMPTLALSNTAAFSILKSHGLDTVSDFPPIRVLGTIGFIVTMWFVNCAVWDGHGLSFTFAENAFKFQYTYNQFLVFGLFKSRRMALFFVFSALLGMSLQVTNSFAGPFITSFKASIDPIISSSFAANNATLLTSISQISEALCILMIPFFLRRYGIKTVMLISMFAWVFRFGFFGIGNPTMPGVLLFILSCIVYGVAFDFFNVSGGLFVDRECSEDIRASAQGLFMLMTNGLGASIGTIIAGMIVNSHCQWTDNGFLVGDWQSCWFIFAGYALVVAVLFAFMFSSPKKQ